MNRPHALAIVDCGESDAAPALPGAVAFARYLARERVRSMMGEVSNDSKPRK